MRVKFIFLIKLILLLPLQILEMVEALYSKLLYMIRPSLGSYWQDRRMERNKFLIKDIHHTTSNGEEISLRIYTPNALCRFRADSFSDKEPETLLWIDKYGGDGALFDIGANIGLYSIYYAATKQGKVYSFEPSVFNLAQLAKNIYINQLQDRVHLVVNPLTKFNVFANFKLSTTDEGGALSAFGVDYGYDGKFLTDTLSYKTLGLPLDFLMEKSLLSEYPEMIKIDVDGIEHLVLEGSIKTISNPKCRTILIEVNDDFKPHSNQINKILTKCGFRIVEKIKSDTNNSGSFSNVFNQIWIK